MKKFESELADVETRMAEMAELAKAMVALATSAVKDRTHDMSDEVAALENKVNQMQMDIDHEAVRMLTVYGPVATDLRYLLVITHVTSKMERIGDEVMNICESLRMMTGDSAVHPTLASLQRMADLVSQMVDDAMDAYFMRDDEKAQITRTHDDIVDALNDQIVKELLTDDVLRDVLSGSRNIADAVAQILMARHLERIADQATNICKEVVYVVRGDDVRHKRKKSAAVDED